MTAAYLQLTAAEPSLCRPHQSLFRFTADVVVEQGHYRPRAGVLRVPDGPGLGVTIDRAALARLHDRYRTEGPHGDRGARRVLRRGLPEAVTPARSGVRTPAGFRHEVVTHPSRL